MKAAWLALGFVVTGLLSPACGGVRESDSSAAIQKAIEKRLTGQSGLASGNMTLEMKDVKVQGDQAQAEVVFHSRSDPNAQMAYHYDLRQQDGEWHVESGHPSAAGSPHSFPEGESQGTLPEGHPPVGQ